MYIFDNAKFQNTNKMLLLKGQLSVGQRNWRGDLTRPTTGQTNRHMGTFF